jgi:hypothetical protein
MDTSKIFSLGSLIAALVIVLAALLIYGIIDGIRNKHNPNPYMQVILEGERQTEITNTDGQKITVNQTKDGNLCFTSSKSIWCAGSLNTDSNQLKAIINFDTKQVSQTIEDTPVRVLPFEFISQQLK